MPIEVTGNLARRSAWVLLQSIEQLLLQRTEGGALVVEPAELEQPVLELVRYLSQNPGDGLTRSGLTKLLSVQVSGSFGLPLIATAALNLAKKTIPVRESSQVETQPSANPDDVLRAFFTTAIPWLDSQSPVVLGRLTLPAELFTAPPNELLVLLTNLLQYTGNRLVDDIDISFLEKQLILGVSIAPHSSTPDAALTLIGLAAGKLALAGHSQRARDLAEHVLQAAGNGSRRARLAWFTFADIYHRVHNFAEALVATACGLACDAQPTLEEAWNETYELIRLVRDLDLGDFAKALLPSARNVLKELGLEEKYGHRLVSLELGICVYVS